VTARASIAATYHRSARAPSSGVDGGSMREDRSHRRKPCPPIRPRRRRDRELPIVNVGPVSVALLNLLGDTRLTEAAAELLAARVPAGVEVLVTPEVKAVPLAHAISVRTGLPYVVVRKTHKPYMVGPVSRTVHSITTGKPQDLVIDGADVPRLRGKAWRSSTTSSRPAAR
jgi:hypothetical protein